MLDRIDSPAIALTKASSVLNYIKNVRADDLLAVINVTPTEFALLIGTRAWIAPDRRAIKNVLDAVIFGAVDAFGMGRAKIPAEWLATIIGAYVNPINWMSATSLYDGVPPAEALASGANLSTGSGVIDNRMSNDQLFSMVAQFTMCVDREEIDKWNHKLAKMIGGDDNGKASKQK